MLKQHYSCSNIHKSHNVQLLINLFETMDTMDEEPAAEMPTTSSRQTLNGRVAETVAIFEKGQVDSSVPQTSGDSSVPQSLASLDEDFQADAETQTELENEQVYFFTKVTITKFKNKNDMEKEMQSAPGIVVHRPIKSSNASKMLRCLKEMDMQSILKASLHETTKNSPNKIKVQAKLAAKEHRPARRTNSSIW